MLLKMFLNAHSGFCRDDIQDYLNLYSFVINPPSDHLEKVEKTIDLVYKNPKSLKYREQFGLNTWLLGAVCKSGFLMKNTIIPKYIPVSALLMKQSRSLVLMFQISLST